MHFDFDSHDTYRASQDDPTRMVPNPAKKLAYRDVEKARRTLQHAETVRDSELLEASSPPPGTSVVLTNQMIDTTNADVHTAEKKLDAALTTHKAIPARLPLAQVHPGQQVLDTETKLIHHAIRIPAFNTAQSLARAIVTATGYTRADDEAHTLIRTALAGSGDIIPDSDTLPTPSTPAPTSPCATASNPTDDPATIPTLCRSPDTPRPTTLQRSPSSIGAPHWGVPEFVGIMRSRSHSLRA